ncbi:MAG: glyoxylase-like metal-dependent hydrolase (beta-lactamase superfamily II) [Colwellia sp.]|jgi:glyoxylase-like metal-dependent hydrolase (beta-lactamase superfamily II)|tara:strand:+ start:1976 stop:2893 length:918 start_codon:yes stop_codon:yes gene_type:complete
MIYSNLIETEMAKLAIKCFFDEITNTATYLIADTVAKECAIIDSVLGFELSTGTTSNELADDMIDYITDKKWQCRWILETHAHADHLTAAPYLQSKLGGKIAIGKHIIDVQKTFKSIFNFGAVFNFEDEFIADGRQFDQLLNEGDVLELGRFTIDILHTPGHTPACISFIVDENAFVGDTLFMPDYGTARCDFPGGDAKKMYHSIQKIFSLPDNTIIFMGHDYKAQGRDFYAWQSTVAEQKSQNIHINTGVSVKKYVAFRNKRDAGLAMPKLILPSVQVNIRAGHFPKAADNGLHYLTLPINAFK